MHQGFRDRCPVRAHAWVADSVPGWGVYKRQLIDVSLTSMFLSGTNMYLKILKYKNFNYYTPNILASDLYNLLSHPQGSCLEKIVRYK